MGFYNSNKRKMTYKLVKNGKAVYIGTTNNPKRRNDEHSKSGKNYDFLEVTSPRVSNNEAGVYSLPTQLVPPITAASLTTISADEKRSLLRYGCKNCLSSHGPVLTFS